MNNNSNEKCCNCIYDILKKILLLQKQDFDCDNYVGCDKPLTVVVHVEFYI